jgi:hypothetical protein
MKWTLLVSVGAALLAGSVTSVRADWANYSNCTWTFEFVEGIPWNLQGKQTQFCPRGVLCQKTTRGTLYCVLNPNCAASVGTSIARIAVTPSGGPSREVGVVSGLGFIGSLNSGSVRLNNPGVGDMSINACKW